MKEILDGKRSEISKGEWIILIFVVSIALWLRTRGLGSLGFYGDEETTALAVQGILKDGYPHMPSGMPYGRAAPYSYLVAGFAYLFGMNEFSVRLPSAVFGTLSIPLLYLFSRRFFGFFPAILASWFLAFSSWHIIFSRMGRMYAMFLFFFLLSVLLFHYGYIGGRKRFRAYAFFSALFTMTLHMLGILLVPLCLTLLVFKLIVRENKIRLLGHFIGIFIFWHVYHRFITISPYKTFMKDFSDGAENLTPASMDMLTFFMKILQTLHLKFTPKFWALSHLLEHQALLLFPVIAVVALVTFYAWRRFGRHSNFGHSLLFYTIILLAFALMNLFGLAFVTLLAGIVFLGSSFKPLIKNKFVWIIALQVILLFAFWSLYGFFGWRGEEFGILSGLELLRKVIKDSIYYPALHVMMYLTAFPLMTIIVMGGSVWWLLESIFNGNGFRNHEILIFLGFWVSLLALGLTREWIAFRYLIALYPFYLLIFAWTMDRGVAWMGEKWTDLKGRKSLWEFPKNVVYSSMIAGLFILFPILNEHHGIREALAVSHLSYGQPVAPSINSSFPFRPDHKGAAEYVERRFQVGDLIVAMDVLEQYYYFGRVDYWLREASDARAYSYEQDKERRDIYTSSRILSTQGELEALIRQPREIAVWLITSGELVGRQEVFIPPGVSKLLSGYDRNLVFRGRDGVTNVYRFDP